MRHLQRGRTLQEVRTAMTPADVLASAKVFFGPRNGLYTAFVERESAQHVVLRGQGGEELIIAVQGDGAATRVTGSTYLFDQQVARFLSSLPPAPEGAAA